MVLPGPASSSLLQVGERWTWTNDWSLVRSTSKCSSNFKLIIRRLAKVKVNSLSFQCTTVNTENWFTEINSKWLRGWVGDVCGRNWLWGVIIIRFHDMSCLFKSTLGLVRFRSYWKQKMTCYWAIFNPWNGNFNINTRTNVFHSAVISFSLRLKTLIDNDTFLHKLLHCFHFIWTRAKSCLQDLQNPEWKITCLSI